MRSRHIFVNGKLTDVTNWQRLPRVGPYIITDSMRAAVHPATGQIFDSKSAFRAVTKAHGLTEVGNDAPAYQVPPAQDLKQDVAQAIDMLEQGYTPAPSDVAGADTRFFT